MDANVKPKTPRRSLLFTPGDSKRKINKVATTGADSVILDLEDAVAVNQKEEARQNVLSALANMDFGRTEPLVRINSADTGWYEADLAAVSKTSASGLVLPKVETARQVQQVESQLAAGEQASGRPIGTIRLLVLIETALGVTNVDQIARSSPRLDALLIGGEDLAADLGATRTQAGWEIFHARGAVITAAAAQRLDAIDTVFLDLANLAGLREDALFVRQLGYTGKLAVHPRQVEVINQIFSPSAAEIAEARSLLEAYESHMAAGSGVFTLDGRMVDKPHILAAERLLARARQSGLLDQ